MKFNFDVEIQPETFHKVLHDVLSRLVSDEIEKQALMKIKEYKTQISKEVELYLAKRLTETEIKNEIDKAKEYIIEETLREYH